jgi:hypothetical protein
MLLLEMHIRVESNKNFNFRLSLRCEMRTFWFQKKQLNKKEERRTVQGKALGSAAIIRSEEASPELFISILL